MIASGQKRTFLKPVGCRGPTSLDGGGRVTLNERMSETNHDILGLVASGDTAGLQAALVAGGDAMARGSWGVSALMRAAALGNRDAVDLLLEHGAEADRSSDAGNTALMAAAARGHLEIVARLLDAGGDPVHQNKWGVSAYDWAKWPSNGTEIEQLMQAQGA